MKSNLYILLIFGIELLVGCRKDTPIPEIPIDADNTCVEEWCYDLPPENGLGYQFNKEGIQYTKPCFNPNNSDEFVYIRENNGTLTELVKYNISTKQEKVLCSSLFIISQPQWSQSGWIIFSAIDQRVWKVFKDGTGLTQITNTKALNPVLDSNGENFLVMSHEISLSSNYRPIFNLQGDLVDSIKFNFDGVYTGYPYFAISHKYKESYQYYVDQNTSPNVSGICLVENDSIVEYKSVVIDDLDIIDVTINQDFLFYSVYWKNIHKIDLSTNTISTFKIGCQTRSFNYISISPNGDKLLVEKQYMKQINNTNNIDEQHEIWLLDIDGCGEKMILGEE